MSREGVTIRKFRKDFDKNDKIWNFSLLVKSLGDFMTVFDLGGFEENLKKIL